MQTPLILLCLVSSITCLTSAATTTTTTTSSSDFIRSSCAATAYQTTCLSSLSPYARAIHSDPRRLGRVALTVSILRARNTTSFVSRLSSPTSPKSSSPSRTTLLSAAFQDCVMLIDDSARRLRQSVGELARMGPAGSPQNAMCMSNVQTWISAALTDQNMCLSSISQAGAAGGEDAAAIMKKVEEARQVTSNALSLVNLIGAN